jgi:oligopeptidase A
MDNAVNQLRSFTLDLSTIGSELDHHLQHCRETIIGILEKNHHTWNTLVSPLDLAEDRLSQFFAPISHLHAVCNTPELREVYEACLAKLSDYHTEVGQNEPLCNAYRQLAESPEYKTLDRAQQKVIQDTLRDFRLSGVDLPESKKQRFKAIAQKISQLTSQFENNIMDATDHWEYHTIDTTELSGLPASTLQAAEEKAKQHDKPGYLLGIDFPTYHAVMSYADSRTLRETFYTAYQTRASDQGPEADRWDNSTLMCELLALRHEEAVLLGFANYAELSLATKMAPSTNRVTQFLVDLAKRSKPFAIKELEQLHAFAQHAGFTDTLQSWDLSYYSEKLKQTEYQISQEALRAYFPVDQVMQGLFSLLNTIFGLTIELIKAPTWHPDVHVYQLIGEDDQPRGHLYVDLYARANKRGGAWMDDGRTRWRLHNGTLQQPIAFLTCNFAPPTETTPALLTHEDVETLFHEMGHCLHHLLSQVDYISVSGIHGVAWDAVELPSQFLENFCWQKPVIDLISKHYLTGKPLPENTLRQLQKARGFQAGMMMLRQVELSLFDFRLYQSTQTLTSSDIQSILDQVRRDVALLTPPAFARFQHSFSHIFAGGYSAGYYSYKWAEVLSADAFSRFEEEGILNPIIGKAFLQAILEKGGSIDPMELFTTFRGREPSIDALLRHNGLTA